MNAAVEDVTDKSDYTYLLEGETDYLIALSQKRTDGNMLARKYKLTIQNGVRFGWDWERDGDYSWSWEERNLMRLVYEVSARASVDELEKLLGEDGKATLLIDRIIEGHETDRDDSYQYYGKLTGDAQEASEELRDLLQGLSGNQIKYCTAQEWLTWESAQDTLKQFNVAVDADEGDIESAAEEVIKMAEEHYLAMEKDDVIGFIGELIEKVKEEEEQTD